MNTNTTTEDLGCDFCGSDAPLDEVGQSDAADGAGNYWLCDPCAAKELAR